MSRRLLCLAVLGLLFVGVPVGGADAVKSLPRIEVRFRDGSQVRMQLLQNILDVSTSYGKMVVPVEQILRIDFAYRLEPAETKRIQAALDALDDSSFQVREKASRELIEIGKPAYPRLKELARSEDLEVSKRVAAIVAELEKKIPASELVFPKEDVIKTSKFTIVGTIQSDSIRAKARYFSDEKVMLTDLRSLRAFSARAATYVSIDAATHSSDRNQWLDTGIELAAGDKLTCVAQGQVDLWPQQPGQYLTGPAGYAQGAAVARARGNNFLPGALVGRVGAIGTQFRIGASYEGTPGASGRLYLQIVRSPWNNASTGTYKVEVSVNP